MLNSETLRNVRLRSNMERALSPPTICNVFFFGASVSKSTACSWNLPLIHILNMILPYSGA